MRMTSTVPHEICVILPDRFRFLPIFSSVPESNLSVLIVIITKEREVEALRKLKEDYDGIQGTTQY